MPSATAAPVACGGDWVLTWIQPSPTPTASKRPSVTPGASPTARSLTTSSGRWGCAPPDCAARYPGVFPYWDAASGYCVAFPPAAATAAATGAAPTGFTAADAAVCTAGGITCVHGSCVCAASYCTCVCESGWATAIEEAAKATLTLTSTMHGTATPPATSSSSSSHLLCNSAVGGSGGGGYTAGQASTPCSDPVSCFFINNVWQAIISVGVVLGVLLVVICCAHRLCCPRVRLWSHCWRYCCLAPATVLQRACAAAVNGARKAQRALKKRRLAQQQLQNVTAATPVVTGRVTYAARGLAPSAPGAVGAVAVRPRAHSGQRRQQLSSSGAADWVLSPLLFQHQGAYIHAAASPGFRPRLAAAGASSPRLRPAAVTTASSSAAASSGSPARAPVISIARHNIVSSAPGGITAVQSVHVPRLQLGGGGGVEDAPTPPLPGQLPSRPLPHRPLPQRGVLLARSPLARMVALLPRPSSLQRGGWR